MGPREAAVRETLKDRPASVLYQDDSEWRMKIVNCFAGLHNGARTVGTLQPNGKLFLGKSECEWDWTEIWPRMVQLGLVTFRLSSRANHPNTGGFTVRFEWTITDHGRTVREDDLKYFRELMDAMHADSEAKKAALT